jgi:ribose transport system ATP-binding protein
MLRTALPALSVRDLSCSFGTTRALSGVDLEVHPGEVVALLGQNGAGKSTLIKILAGVYRPTAGEVTLGDKTFRGGLHPSQAKAGGLAFVHQDFGLVEQLSVAENIAHVAGFESMRGMIRWSRQAERAREILEPLEFRLPVEMPVMLLDPAHRALVAIGRALATGARAIVFDEPTAALPRHDVEILFSAIDKLREQGVAVIYVTHRLAEVSRVADRVVVLRDGRKVADARTDQLTHESIVEQIVGGELAGATVESGTPGAIPLLQLHKIAGKVVRDVSFRLRHGEILALVGLVGAGQREIAHLIGGVNEPDEGWMRLEGEPYAPTSPRQALRCGVAHLPADRLRDAGFLNYDTTTNFFNRPPKQGAWIRPAAQRRRAESVFKEWRITPTDPTKAFGALSGGNQQRLLLAKWMDHAPSLLIADEPTAGVDVGARHAIYQRIGEAARHNVATLLVSSDAEEVADLAHRALVFRDGRVTYELQRRDLTVERITLECVRG